MLQSRAYQYSRKLGNMAFTKNVEIYSREWRMKPKCKSQKQGFPCSWISTFIRFRISHPLPSDPVFKDNSENSRSRTRFEKSCRELLQSFESMPIMFSKKVFRSCFQKHLWKLSAHRSCSENRDQTCRPLFFLFAAVFWKVFKDWKENFRSWDDSNNNR